MSTFTSLSAIFTRYETVIVTEVSNGDLFGYARAKLSDGGTVMAKHPLVGEVWATAAHPPDIVRPANRDTILITPWNEPTFEITWAEIIPP